MECSSIYSVVKDFAAPAAVIVGSGVAGTIAYIFGRAQKQIASSQRDIALDKLKFDLFERRFAIYSALRNLIEHVVSASDLKDIDHQRLDAADTVIGEALFFFPEDIRKLTSEIRARITTFVVHLKSREDTSIDNSDAWKKIADQLTEDTLTLLEHHTKLPDKFASSLRFEQLTSRP